MKIILILSLLATALSFPDKKLLPRPQIPGLNSQHTRVVGGANAPPNSQPHQVSLQYRSGSGWAHFCGGSIISTTKVVTAAHCVLAANGAVAGFRVVAGEHDLNVENVAEQASNWKSARSHPSYDADMIDWDYGVVTLETPLEFNSNVQPIELARSDLEASGECNTSGWGYTDADNTLPNVLQLIKLPIVPREKCAEIYGAILWDITDRMVCAGGDLGRSVCNGDSGGPLVCTGSAGAYLAGITSYTMTPCGETIYPSGWANVAKGRDWLLAN